MTPIKRQRLEEIFIEAAELGPGDRTALLDLKCEGDAELRREVESLLGHHKKTGGVLDSPKFPGQTLRSGFVSAMDETTLPAERRIGAYTILSLLGTGGMGVVYVAEQERPKRTVALKVIRKGLASPRLIRRFEHEADLLGRLQHPGIAQIYEAGAAGEGPHQQPFIAMELVNGLSLTKYAQERKLPTNERLGLMIRVCDAVQHAHQRGVIHRDLKPGNILVNELGEPKILDFGIARAIDADLNATTIQTGIGQLIGTLPYMSPEQVASDTSEVDTRSDVYALGVILYEMLAGRLPHDLKSRSVPEAARIIRDEDPPRLSAVNKIFRGDIDTIVTKALVKEKSRRYQSAAELASDLRHYLAGEPIEARRDSTMYTLKKQLRRYRGTVFAAAACVLALIGFAAYAFVQEGRERDQKNVAIKALEDRQREAKRADLNYDRLVSQFRESNVERGRVLARVGSMRLAEELIWREHLRDPESRYTTWALRELYSRRPCLAAVTDADGQLTACGFAPDSSAFVAATMNGQLALRDAVTGEERWRAAAPKGQVFAVAFAPDGKTVLTAGADGHVRLWDAATGALAGELDRTHAGGATGMHFDASRGVLVTCGMDGALRFWDWPSRSVRRTIEIGKGLRSIDLAREAEIGAVGDVTGTVHVFNRETGEILHRIKAHRAWVTAVAVSPDGTLAGSGASDRSTKVLDLTHGVEVGVLPESNDFVLTMEFSRDGKVLAAGGWWHVEFWDPFTRKRLGQLAGHRDVVNALAYSPDGRTLVSASRDGTIRIWDLTPDAGVAVCAGHAGAVWGAAFAPDARSIASVGEDGTLRLWSVPDGQPLRKLDGGNGLANNVAYMPDGKSLIVGYRSGHLRVWDLATGECTMTIPAHHPDALTLVVSPDHKVLASGGRDRRVILWNLPSMTHLKDSPLLNDPAGTLSFSADGKRLLVGPSGRTLEIWNIEEGTVIHPPVPGNVWVDAYNDDATRIVGGTWEGTIDLFDAQTQKPAGSLVGHERLVTAVVFSHDGTMIASGTVDGSIKLWDVASSRNLTAWERQSGTINQLLFNDSDTVLAAVSKDGTLVLYDLDYFNRHIAGNAMVQYERAKAELGTAVEKSKVEAWAKQLRGGSVSGDKSPRPR